MTGKKYDGGKLRLDLIPPEAIDALGEVLTYGADKYEPYNWAKGLKFSRVYGAALRHLNAYWKGEDVDSESGIDHLKHALTNLAFLVSYSERGMIELDDRYNQP